MSDSARTGFMVHHSAGPDTQRIRDIQSYHMDNNGWADIGYNFLIDKDGGVFEGRGWNTVGAHASGANTANIGVCVIGDYSSRVPSRGVRDSLQGLYVVANERAGKTLTVRTHRDVNPTACPGDALHDWAHNELHNNNGGVRPRPPAHNDDEVIMSLPMVQQGASGAHVRRVQALCIAYGGTPRTEINNSGGIDGIYGPGTVRAVRAVQNDGAPPVDGITGPVTWRALLGV